MKKLILAAAAASSAFLFAGLARAQAPGGGGHFGAMILAADANKDGKVTKAELQAARAAQFAKLDKNNDGFLSADEFGEMGDRATRMDDNKDGKLSKAEFTNVDHLFERLDKNKDGVIDKSEIPAGRPPG